MSNINQNLVNIENDIFGVATFGESIFIDNTTNPIRSGIYYTKIFQKNSNEFWNQVNWLSNNPTIFGSQKVEIRTRTGSALPINYTTGLNYTLDELNLIIETQPVDVIDSILERATLNRSIISNVNASGVTSTNIGYERLGTSYNSFRISSSDDVLWNYWSLPIINSPSFIPNNREYNYLQARIWLQSNDNITIPQVFNINFSSVLKSTNTTLTK